MLKNALVVLPLASEFQYFTEALSSFGLSASDSKAGPIAIRSYPDFNLICAVGGHGKVQFGIQTQFLLSQFPESQRVFCVGAAGGLIGVKTFDVVIAEQTIEHDYTERFDPSPLPAFSGCALTLTHTKGRAAPRHWPFSVHHGHIASGDEDIISPERGREIHAKTRALAVAWEGAGGARAAAFNQKPYLEIRGITDVADNSAPVDFRANLKKAMAHVALFLRETT